MEEVFDLKRQLKDEQQRVKVLSDKLAMYEDEDLEKEGYFSLKGYVKQQVELLSEFKLREEISKNPKDDKYYDRVKAVGEGLKTMLTDLRALKIELKITNDDEKKHIVKTQNRTSPESIASSLGNIAGQKN